MKFINRLICKFSRRHRYSYFSDYCVRCGKLKSSARAQMEEKTL